jgi:hypothetical protein
VWTRPGIARLRLTLPEDAPAGRLRVYLGLQAPAAPVTVGLRAFGAEAGPPPFATVAAPALGAFTCVLDVAEPGREMVVEIDGGAGQVLGTRKLPDGRLVGIGVTSVMICTIDDLAARIGFLEQHAFRVLRPE